MFPGIQQHMTKKKDLPSSHTVGLGGGGGSFLVLIRALLAKQISYAGSVMGLQLSVWGEIGIILVIAITCLLHHNRLNTCERISK